MFNTHQLLRERLLFARGLGPNPMLRWFSFNILVKSEWSTKFEQLMRNRLIMGALRYGRLGMACKPTYDHISSINKRLAAYNLTGNKELLVDCANLCLCEFVECHHLLAHFNSIDDGEHVTIKSQ
jgi:hypothetical protein